MIGASAIELAWTAQGRLDACILFGNKPWDTSAGVLIAREAGTRVLDHDGFEHLPQSRSTIAVTPPLEPKLMTARRAAWPSRGRPTGYGSMLVSEQEFGHCSRSNRTAC
jgi:myo-inositol-1(or 4)-monophosphatase